MIVICTRRRRQTSTPDLASCGQPIRSPRSPFNWQWVCVLFERVGICTARVYVTFRTTILDISSSIRLVSLVFGKGLMSLYGSTMSGGKGPSLFHASFLRCSKNSFKFPT